MKKIIKKSDILDYCIWYLEEVKGEARAVEIASYALENKLVAKSTPINSESVAYYLRRDIFDKEPGKNGTLIYSLREGI